MPPVVMVMAWLDIEEMLTVAVSGKATVPKPSRLIVSLWAT